MRSGLGMLAAGEPLPSVREMSALQGVPVATLQHALAVLADEGLSSSARAGPRS